MKKKDKGVVKGAPSGFVISIMVHAAAFLLAGMFVVFTVHQKEEKKFIPPKPVDRPKMKLKKPKVKVKKTAKPKSTTRIVTKIQKANMPDIQLPELSGVSDGLGDGISGFDMIPDLGSISTLGSDTSIGNDLTGTYYDFKFTRSGRYKPVDVDEWRYIFSKFYKDDWKSSHFSRFYKSPKKLYSTALCYPPSISAMAPVAFGMPDDMASGGLWVIHYKGQISHKDGITFRFWVSVDDSLAIRIDKKVVIAASFISPNDGQSNRAPQMYHGAWTSSSPQSERYIIGQGIATVGDWVTLEPGVSYDFEVVVTDNNFQGASFLVMVEEEGVEYPKGEHGAPILPIFKTEELTHDHLDKIIVNMPPNEINLTNGPTFRDY